MARGGSGGGVVTAAMAAAIVAFGTGCVGPGFGAGAGPGAGAGVGMSAGAGREEGPEPEDVAEEHAHEGAGQAEDHEEAKPLVNASANASATGLVAARYAALGKSACEAELGKRQIAYEPLSEARGVVAPLRLKGAIAGVEFHSMLPPRQRATSVYEIYDCRLVLALDDFARILAKHDVVEVVHYSVYRPPPARAVAKGPGRRHGGALAIDMAIFKTRDGKSISVEKDFHGRIGGKPCLESPPAGSAGTLRKIVCEAADAQLFNVLLTPDYNRQHRNHFHFEVTAGARWVFVR